MSEYDKQARAFLNETGVTMTAVFLKHGKHFPNDTHTRDIYQIILSRGTKGFSFPFGQSLKDTEHNQNAAHRKLPSAYDVLSCLQKSEPTESVDEFAEEFGFTSISEAVRTHNAVKEEWRNVSDLWSPEQIEILQEIN